jgi:hypothetical protein
VEVSGSGKYASFLQYGNKYDQKCFRAQATGWISLTLLLFHFYDKTVVASPAYDYLFLLIKSFVLF